jgi:hypothetical protein
MTGQGQLITGVVVGAGAMYLLDPECGSRRRALLQDQDRWSPRTRLVLGAAGGLMAVKGLRTRGRGGEILTALGTALLSRAVSGTPPQALVDLVTERSTANPSAPFEERDVPVVPAPAQEELAAAHGPRHRRTTKSTKRGRTHE